MIYAFEESTGLYWSLEMSEGWISKSKTPKEISKEEIRMFSMIGGLKILKIKINEQG